MLRQRKVKGDALSLSGENLMVPCINLASGFLGEWCEIPVARTQAK